MGDADMPAGFQKHGEMLANRVKKRYQHLHKRFTRENIEVFRLYDWDIPEIRAVVDWYAGHLVIGEYTRRQSVPGWLSAMGTAVAGMLRVPKEKLHLKRRLAGKQGGERYRRLDTTERKIVVRERDLKFVVNPDDFVDTGLFADHRNTTRQDACNIFKTILAQNRFDGLLGGGEDRIFLFSVISDHFHFIFLALACMAGR